MRGKNDWDIDIVAMYSVVIYGDLMTHIIL